MQMSESLSLDLEVEYIWITDQALKTDPDMSSNILINNLIAQ